MLIVNAEIPHFAGGAPGAVDVRVVGREIVAIGRLAVAAGEKVVDARGGTLLPGLHDHHIHLFALAAARESVDCTGASSTGELVARLRAAKGEWVRAINYDESLAGDLDRHVLDDWLRDRCLRVQHRTGKMWFFNSAAVDAYRLDEDDARVDLQADLRGLERDSAGRANGRLFRLDEWLRSRLPDAAAPALTGVSAELAGYGVTGVTDTSPDNNANSLRLLATRQQRGDLLQRVRVMTALGVTPYSGTSLVAAGEHKIMLDEHVLPSMAALVERISQAHDERRGVALHCVTRIELLFSLAALEEAGTCRRDRLEHASVVPGDVLSRMRALGITVVSQPGLLLNRGDGYLRDVDRRDWNDLYRAASLVAAGIPYGCSSDAPYGPADPWAGMRAAVTRLTAAGAAVGASEALTPEQAIGGYLSHADDPGGAGRNISVGGTADLMLLAKPWVAVRKLLDPRDVLLTIRAGEVIHEATRRH